MTAPTERRADGSPRRSPRPLGSPPGGAIRPAKPLPSRSYTHSTLTVSGPKNGVLPNEQLQLTEVIAVEVKQYVEPDGGRVNIVPRVIGETEMAHRVKRTGGGARRPRVTEEQFYAQMGEACRPELAERVLALYEHAKARRSRQKFGLQSTTVWLGEHEDPEIANPLALIFSCGDGGEIHLRFRHFRERRTPEEMERLVELLRRLPGTSEALDEAVAKDYRTSCKFRPELVLATDEDLEAFKRVLDEAAVRTAATD